ncbi:UNKNOWN [Stylonychia lemnae]|uniref:Tudor-knot domain-containing protein n=1 Tax=Stylonychia lemnae TaxID=5949 RepID=A0A077ZZP9_STYLE|nr:UNKNOWN [Stylonychia lemnae]|eukprot:CDW74693.1 UNKNOWN [Stylonychia lemnae]
MDSSEHQVEVSNNSDVKDLKSKIEEIQNQQVVHLVASLQNNNEPVLQQNQQQNPSSLSQINQSTRISGTAVNPLINLGNPPQINGGQGIDLVSEISRTINESNLARRNRRLTFQQNARQYLHTINLNQRESSEVIRQNIWQLRSIIESRNNYSESLEQMTEPSPANSQMKELPAFSLDNRKFEVGQWVDVKDTIDQWLEAQILEIRDNKVFVHYNGWGTRWDEWIEFSSPRLAAFRQYTVQNPRCNYLSPSPNIQPDALNFQSPSATNNELGGMLNEMVAFMSETSKMIVNFNEQRDNLANQVSTPRDQMVSMRNEEEKKQQIDEFSSLMEFDEERKQQQNLGNSRIHINAGNTSNNRYAQADQNPQIIHNAAQLAPVMDRLGRMLTDLAPHLNNIVKHHQHRQSLQNINANGPASSHANPQHNQSLTSQDLRNDSIQSAVIENPNAPIIVSQQIPIMHSPGEILSVANIFDNRIFDDNSDSNIEFHIHAFLSPQQQQQQHQEQRINASDLINSRLPQRQNAQVGPSGFTRSNSQSQISSQQNIASNNQPQIQTHNLNPAVNTSSSQQPNILRQIHQITQTPLEQINQQTQTAQDESNFIAPSQILPSTLRNQLSQSHIFQESLQQNQNNLLSGMSNFLNQGTSIYRPVGPFGTLNDIQNQESISQPNSNTLLAQFQNAPIGRRSQIDSMISNSQQNTFRSNNPQSLTRTLPPGLMSFNRLSNENDDNSPFDRELPPTDHQEDFIRPQNITQNQYQSRHGQYLVVNEHQSSIRGSLELNRSQQQQLSNRQYDEQYQSISNQQYRSFETQFRNIRNQHSSSSQQQLEQLAYEQLIEQSIIQALEHNERSNVQLNPVQQLQSIQSVQSHRNTNSNAELAARRDSISDSNQKDIQANIPTANSTQYESRRQRSQNSQEKSDDESNIQQNDDRVAIGIKRRLRSNEREQKQQQPLASLVQSNNDDDEQQISDLIKAKLDKRQRQIPSKSTDSNNSLRIQQESEGNEQQQQEQIESDKPGQNKFQQKE